LFEGDAHVAYQAVTHRRHRGEVRINSDLQYRGSLWRPLAGDEWVVPEHLCADRDDKIETLQ
jgi:hypothetical protein